MSSGIHQGGKEFNWTQFKFVFSLDIFFFSQIETEYGKGAWSGNIYRDVVAFPGDGEIMTYENNRWLLFNE